MLQPFGNEQARIEWEMFLPTWFVWCYKHKHYTRITDAGSNSGFAGGGIYWANFACGATEMDESADVAAAY